MNWREVRKMFVEYWNKAKEHPSYEKRKWCDADGAIGLMAPEGYMVQPSGLRVSFFATREAFYEWLLRRKLLPVLA